MAMWWPFGRLWRGAEPLRCLPAFLLPYSQSPWACTRDFLENFWRVLSWALSRLLAWALSWALSWARDVGRAFLSLGPGVVILALRRRMGLDATELRRGLEQALGVSGVQEGVREEGTSSTRSNIRSNIRSSIQGGPSIQGGRGGLDEDCAAWRYTGPGFCLEACCWSAPPLCLGSLRLVQSMVSLRFHALDVATVSVLLRRVELALQRGGG